VYVNPVFNEDHYRNVYSSESYMQIIRDLGESSHEYRVDRFGKERMKILAPHLGGFCSVPPRFLDVGCSTGFVVEAAKKEGWDAYGIDLNPSAVSFGRSRGLNLSLGDLDQSEFEPASFDVVTMFDVIEHVIDPSDLIKQAIRLLRPGGLIFLYVPNYDSASRILLKEKAHFIWPTHHLTYFTPKTLEAFITSLGLKPLYLETEGMDIEDYIWHLSAQGGVDTDCLRTISDELQFFINAGGYGKNLRILARYN
jgi:2-polyprenyl-3-methyl-5-hydroxy-6-metoxy-1,4-benzoquinol methylase